MKQAIALSLVLAAVFLLAQKTLGFWSAASLGFGFVIVIAAVNALTFLWLWWARATPLALGMTLAWAGQACLTAWLYLHLAPQFRIWEGPNVVLFLLLSFYLVGGALHIAVMQRSMELSRVMVVAPFIVALAVAVASSALV